MNILSHIPGHMNIFAYIFLSHTLIDNNSNNLNTKPALISYDEILPIIMKMLTQSKIKLI